MATLTYAPSWVATLSARDNAKKRGNGLVSFPLSPTSSLVNVNCMQMPCVVPINSTQFIHDVPTQMKDFIGPLQQSTHGPKLTMLSMRSRAMQGRCFCGTYSQQSTNTT